MGYPKALPIKTMMGIAALNPPYAGLNQTPR